MILAIGIAVALKSLENKSIIIKGTLIYFPGIIIIINGNPVRAQGIVINIDENLLGIDKIFPITIYYVCSYYFLVSFAEYPRMLE